MKRSMLALFTLLTLCMMGCNEEFDNSDKIPDTVHGAIPDEDKPTPAAANNVFKYANKAYTIELDGKLSIQAKGANYIAAADKAEPFYMKPSALGEYMFYDSDRKFLAATDGAVTRTAELSNNVRWELTYDEDLAALLLSPWRADKESAPNYLTRNGQNLALTASKDDAAKVSFTLTEKAYAKFPEAELNVTFYDEYDNELKSTEFTHENYMAKTPVGEKVIGYMDAHAHLNHFLGSGQTNFVGETFNPLGIEKALDDCSFAHGPEGVYDIFGMVVDGHVTHKTGGYPDFPFWPTAYTQTHQQAYYKWIERAWLSGERVFIQQMVSNEILCDLKKQLPGANPAAPCNDMQIADLQIQNMYDMQDYIDAQCGGRGMGWFRICVDAEQARQVISEGKMAVFLALEFDTVFNVDEDIKGIYGEGSDEWATAQKLILDQLDRYTAWGITSIFPVHAFNNGFAGSQLYNAPIFGLVNWIERGQWFNVEPAVNPRVRYKEQGIEYSDAEYADFLSQLGFLFPFVPATEAGHSNALGLTETGRWLIEQMIERQLIIEMDHLSDKATHEIMEIVWDAKYPGIIYSHTDILDFRPDNNQDAYERIDIPNMIKTWQLGGIVTPNLWSTVRGVQEPIVEYLEAVMYDRPEDQTRLEMGADVAGISYERFRDFDNDGEADVHPRWYDGDDDPYEIVQSWYMLNDDDRDDLIEGVSFATDVNGACPLPNFKTAALWDESATDWPEDAVFADYLYDHLDPVTHEILDKKDPMLMDPDGDGKYSFGALYDGVYKAGVRVEFKNQVTGNVSFNIEDPYRAMSHYGLMPDMFRKLHLCREKGDTAETDITDEKRTFYTEALFNSAEAYLRMRERTERYTGRDDNSPSAYPSRNPADWD